MNIMAALLSAFLVAGSAAPSVLAPTIPARPQIHDAATLRAVLASDVLTPFSEAYLLQSAPRVARDALYSDLMAQLKDKPYMALEGWQAMLLSEHGEAILVSRRWPDGHEMTLDEMKEFLDELSRPQRGKGLTPNELFARKGITVRSYWKDSDDKTP
jgi:hypothetical protein